MSALSALVLFAGGRSFATSSVSGFKVSPAARQPSLVAVRLPSFGIELPRGFSVSQQVLGASCRRLQSGSGQRLVRLLGNVLHDLCHR